jgi:hypothetical protein
MAYLDMKRKQITTWPWVAGLMILGLIVWAVTSLLAAPVDEERSATAAVVEEELPPATLPMQVNPIGIVPLRDVRELSPLGTEDVGETVRAEGEILATGTEGFWILAGLEVIRVESEEIVRKGQIVQVHGTLQEDDPERTERVAAEVLSRSPQAGDWRIVRGIKLVADRGPAAGEASDGGVS